MQIANKVLQMTQTALGSFGVSLSHNGLVPIYGSLPVVRARFGRLSTGVSNLPRHERLLVCSSFHEPILTQE